MIAWHDTRNGDWDIYAQRIRKNGSLGWEFNGIPVCLMSGYQSGAQCVSNGVGGAVITWQDHRNENWDIYAQRVDSSGILLWETNGIGICMADSTQGPYVVETDNGSGAIISWMDYRAGNWDIYCQRVDSSGTPQWGKDGLGVCTDRDWEGYPIMVADGAGGAIIAWDHAPAGKAGVRANVCAQRVDSSGNLRWGGIRDEPWGDVLPREVSLGQNRPNPFNLTTVISYQVSAVSGQPEDLQHPGAEG